jgi:small Trp-rich protein
MWFVVIGTLLVVLKLVGVEPVAGWSWLWVLAPFGLAVLWWAWADKSGLTQRKAMDRLDERKEERRRKAMEALGQGEQQRRK